MFFKVLSNFGLVKHGPASPNLFGHETLLGVPLAGAGEILHDLKGNQWNNNLDFIVGQIKGTLREVIVPKSYLQPL